MEYKVEVKNVHISPRKMRLVVDGVKKLPLGQALQQLMVMNKRAALPLRKAILSAIANAKQQQANEQELLIKNMFVGEGVKYRRYHYAARGRVRPYKRRMSHLTVVLSAKAPKVAVAPKTEAKNEENKVEKMETQVAVKEEKVAKKELLKKAVKKGGSKVIWDRK